jgi:hypothetical protein
MPINVNLFPDMAFREEVGITPDLWVPAADAVNYAVAAVRAGTITTQQPLSPGVLQQPLEPEDPWSRGRRGKVVQWLLVAALPVAAAVWVYFTRRKPKVVAAVGVVWLAVGGASLLMERPVGLGFLLAGGVCLVWGGASLLRARRKATQDTAA